MTPAKIILRHQGKVILEIECRMIVHLLMYSGSIARGLRFKVDESTEVHTVTNKYIQSDRVMTPEEVDEATRRFGQPHYGHDKGE